VGFGVHVWCLTPRHGAPPWVPRSIVKLLPMFLGKTVTHVPGLYHRDRPGRVLGRPDCPGHRRHDEVHVQADQFGREVREPTGCGPLVVGTGEPHDDALRAEGKPADIAEHIDLPTCVLAEAEHCQTDRIAALDVELADPPEASIVT
jgi:hypothetical protein